MNVILSRWVGTYLPVEALQSNSPRCVRFIRSSDRAEVNAQIFEVWIGRKLFKLLIDSSVHSSGIHTSCNLKGEARQVNVGEALLDECSHLLSRPRHESPTRIRKFFCHPLFRLDINVASGEWCNLLPVVDLAQFVCYLPILGEDHKKELRLLVSSETIVEVFAEVKHVRDVDIVRSSTVKVV
jgi:hypothetical protein